MATKAERIAQIEQYPDTAIFIVRSPNGMLWKKGDMGYTEDMNEAKKFTREDIISRLQHNGLMDKTIEVFTSQSII